MEKRKLNREKDINEESDLIFSDMARRILIRR